MEIIIGPKCTEGDRKLIDLSCGDNSNIKIVDSIWTGRLKKT